MVFIDLAGTKDYSASTFLICSGGSAFNRLNNQGLERLYYSNMDSKKMNSDSLFNRKEIVRFITGECSVKERKRIEAWMKDNPKNKEVVEEFRQTWELSQNLMLKQNEDVAWQKLSQRISRPNHMVSVSELQQKSDIAVDKKQDVYRSSGFSKKVLYQSWLLRIAAVSLLALCISFVLYFYNSNLSKVAQTQSEMKEVVAERGERIHVTFSDGTSVVLNSSSVIRFPNNFEGDSRNVELDGEAFFNVTRKADVPFIVHTKEAIVQVLGTKFNVNAYPGDEKVEVVVADGKVAVSSEPDKNSGSGETGRIGNNGVVLRKGEYTLVTKEGGPSVPKKVALKHYLGWIDGELIFKATPLDIVIRRLELYYDQDFAVSDSSLFNRRLTTSFDNESLSKVLEVLSAAMDLEYEQGDNLILLKPYRQSQH